MDFYRINEEYNRFLQRYEKEKRGVTKVPNIRYTDRNKFAFGAVMQVNGMNYYVSVSSFDKKQEANILIRVPGDEKEVKGSLRFQKKANKIYEMVTTNRKQILTDNSCAFHILEDGYHLRRDKGECSSKCIRCEKGMA